VGLGTGIGGATRGDDTPEGVDGPEGVEDVAVLDLVGRGEGAAAADDDNTERTGDTDLRVGGDTSSLLKLGVAPNVGFGGGGRLLI
jgi:hypothetical protein